MSFPRRGFGRVLPAPAIGTMSCPEPAAPAVEERRLALVQQHIGGPRPTAITRRGEHGGELGLVSVGRGEPGSEETDDGALQNTMYSPLVRRKHRQAGTRTFTPFTDGYHI
jgi:hypothetical protein